MFNIIKLIIKKNNFVYLLSGLNKMLVFKVSDNKKNEEKLENLKGQMQEKEKDEDFDFMIPVTALTKISNVVDRYFLRYYKIF
jgi:hypothetical protein